MADEPWRPLDDGGFRLPLGTAGLGARRVRRLGDEGFCLPLGTDEGGPASVPRAGPLWVQVAPHISGVSIRNTGTPFVSPSVTYPRTMAE